MQDETKPDQSPYYEQSPDSLTEAVNAQYRATNRLECLKLAIECTPGTPTAETLIKFAVEFYAFVAGDACEGDCCGNKCCENR